MEEDMEIYHVVDVPDTPDRSNAWKSDRKCVGNPEKRECVFPVSGEASNTRSYITVSSSEKSHPSKNGPIFRRAQSEKAIVLGTTHPSRVQMMEKGKALSSKFPAKQSHHGHNSVLDLAEDNERFKQPKPVFLHRTSRGNAIEDKKELRACSGSSLLPSISDSSNTSGNAFPGKCNLDSKTLPGPNIFMDRGKSISVSTDSQSQSKTEKQISLPPCLFNAPSGRGHKRLVRNGCISPQNIATREKQSAGQSSLQTNHVEQSHAGHSASSNTMSPISVDEIVAEEQGGGRGKGKGVLINPSSDGINDGTIHADNSSRVINYKEVNGTSNATRSSLENCEGQGGWRTTHNEKNAGQHLFDVNGQHSGRHYNVGRIVNGQNMNRMDRSVIGSTRNGKFVPSLQPPPPHAVFSIPEIGDSTRPRHTADSLTKRQRKRESSSGNPNEASHNSEIIFLDSSGESSSSSRSRVMNPELVELLATPSFTNRLSEDLDDNDNNSDARAMQLEADEILARELQEQLYRDEFFEGAGVDEHFASEMQHTENLLHTSIDSHNISHPTSLPRENRQPRTRSHQNPLSRRRNVAQAPFSSRRMSQLRNRMASRSSTAVLSSRGRRPRFPLDMDLHMRLDILEALEDFNEMGMADDIFNVHRDFNEDDYEMLLALDEQNHQHTGASSNQINNLPQSTIQTDNFTETCAICLETPVKGETIRHLPCLHKFHKDCIDPWLQRKTSCPVCKSSIT